MNTFDIDKTKVQQLIDEGPEGYSVAASNLHFPVPVTTVYSVDFTAPAEMIDPEKYFADLRQRVLDSGISLVSREDIDREIGEMRRHDL